ncbi:DUF7410 domain-containing protein [Halalkalicoccus jeotgali]|uniref:DNA binding protein n=1 Tax=Halalkalicoccus jeotgali (strain DSM 18796 / CECT 7217 / JCM 14584 / KCTC 4019 / B3) TaxID=795797 RepID=D8J5K2_HALJB|nr:hypothetical protein [Halalkalicoccus jeotgali]ADJ15698.1 putative DNA binding protein [Halalkalicoccus jeotgali B3]ELY36532.1 putative DNA binding protein [Halalkalicoccus jeotgali B3]
MSAPVFERADEAPATCPECGRPFARTEYVTLHLGLDHPEVLSESDRERFVEVYRGETEEMKRFRLKALAALLLVYFGFLYLYLFVG